MAETKAGGGLITVEDDKPDAGFGRIVTDAIELVPAETWTKLLAGKPATVRLVDSLESPVWAEGKWNGGSRTARVKRMYRGDGKPRRNKVAYTALHELAGHGSDSSSMGAGKRTRIMALMTPRPSHWRDTGSADPDTMAGYWALPYESYANRLVEALTLGEIRSPYDDDYTRVIEEKHLDELLRIVAGEDQPTPAPEPEPEPPDNPELAEILRMLEASRAEVRHYEEITLGAVQLLWDDAWGERPSNPEA